MVRGICTELGKLIDGSPGAQRSQKQVPKISVPKQPSDSDIRKMIREEAQDRLERERRKELIIVRGFTEEETDGDCAVQVTEIFEELVGRKVTYSDFMRFEKRQDLVRVKVLNDTDRRSVIANASKLRSSARSRFFVRRDLTWLQRKDLKARYEKRKAENKNDNRTRSDVIESDQTLRETASIRDIPSIIEESLQAPNSDLRLKKTTKTW